LSSAATAQTTTVRGVVDHLWLGYLAVGGTLVVAYYLIPASGAGLVIRVVTYCVMSASAAAAVWHGVARHRPRPRLPWVLLGLSQLVYAAADATFYTGQYLLDMRDFPSAADPLYLSHYPLVVVGLTLLIRYRAPGGDLPGLLDAGVIAVVAGMFSWLYLMEPQANGSSVLATAASLAYPAMDLALLVVGLRLVLTSGRRSASFFLLIANLAAILTADTVYVLQQLAGTYHPGNFLDAIWLTGNLALGAAALHPTMTRLAEGFSVRDRSLGPGRIAALAAVVLVAPATLLVQHARGEFEDIPAIASVCAVLFVLTIARMTGLVADQRRLAISDSLTGLYTRRFIETQLALEVTRARRNGTPLGLFIADIDHFKPINDRYGHPAGDRALIEIAARLREAARPGDVLARYGGEEFALLAPGVAVDKVEEICERIRLAIRSRPVAVGATASIGVTVSVGAASLPAHAACPTELVATADRALYAAKARGRDCAVIGDSVESARDPHSNGPRSPCPRSNGSVSHLAAEPTPAVVDLLHQLADKVDAWLSVYEHSTAVGRWAALLAIELGQDDKVLHHVTLAARLHDIGKIIIPEAILTKPGALTEAEWALLRQHPDHGARLAGLVPGFEQVADIIRQHHERFDGTGYPRQLAGSAVRIEARIIAVCDSWAAMRADRAYQAAVSVDVACEQLRRGRGGQFDPKAVDVFLELHRQGRIGELERIRPSHSHELTSASVFQNISS
jgi:diguanylate cyclase (GGDEF)-like protein